MKKDEVLIERIPGKPGPGGQRKNKKAVCIRATHRATGITVTIDGRSQERNLRVALKELEKKLEAEKKKKADASRKQRRDHAIKNEKVIRTYDFKSKTVRDHRTKKTAPLKEVLEKGRIDLVAPSWRDAHGG